MNHHILIINPFINTIITKFIMYVIPIFSFKFTTIGFNLFL